MANNHDRMQQLEGLAQQLYVSYYAQAIQHDAVMLDIGDRPLVNLRFQKDIDEVRPGDGHAASVDIRFGTTYKGGFGDIGREGMKLLQTKLLASDAERFTIGEAATIVETVPSEAFSISLKMRGSLDTWTSRENSTRPLQALKGVMQRLIAEGTPMTAQYVMRHIEPWDDQVSVKFLRAYYEFLTESAEQEQKHAIEFGRQTQDVFKQPMGSAVFEHAVGKSVRVVETLDEERRRLERYLGILSGKAVIEPNSYLTYTTDITPWHRRNSL